MNRPRNEHVVVGVDGSAPSLAALRWAAGEARLRGRPLHVIHCFVWPSFAAGYGLIPDDWFDPRPRVEAQRLMAEWIEQARAMAGGVLVTGVVVDGPAAPVLIEESREAATVVVGTRGTGGFAGLLLGSVATQVATHAHGPVVVVRPDFDPQTASGQRVVVGVDGSDAADVAAGYAFAIAAERSVELVAVRAWNPPKPPWRIDVRPLVMDVDEIATAEMGLLRSSLARWEAAYPHVRVEQCLVAEHAANALVSASQGAQLLVVGSRGRGGLLGRLLGSVSLRVLHHADCAVAVVHPDHVAVAPDSAVAAEGALGLI